MMTRTEFDKLSPSQQGYACYMLGARDGAPDFLKHCPYTKGTEEYKEFGHGEFAAMLECMELEE